MRTPLTLLRALYKRSLPMGAKIAGRRTWVRLARRLGYPISSSHLPRPLLARGRPQLRLTHALMACDLNPRYLESWELVARAWPEVAGIEPVLVLVADEDGAPPDLAADPRVRLFPPLDGVPTSLQAQCVRLLYPALLEGDGAVLTSDVDIVPLDPRYFREPIAALDARFFVSYRDILLERGQLAMVYNAARPETWAEIFGVRDPAALRVRLEEWTAPVVYDGVRGGKGWYTDQELLHRFVIPWGRRSGRHWALDDDFTGFLRLDREVVELHGLTDTVRSDVARGRYTDFHSFVPHSERRGINDEVLGLATRRLRPVRGRRLGSARWRPRH